MKLIDRKKDRRLLKQEEIKAMNVVNKKQANTMKNVRKKK
jgi:hypothetical protein